MPGSGWERGCVPGAVALRRLYAAHGSGASQLVAGLLAIVAQPQPR